MLIKGIRSFDPENKHVITFFKPLTLIVGPNGAGKTTIIECLKLSCTGELPPNARSGHSFIHDPKVAGETETKGQIKLRFKTAAGKDVVCIRSFQLTQKATKMEYKAIESVLQTINPHTGEKVCLSYRCADMDREIPALMGVSKAILENVIFVHQDEANWPLQDPSTLKKKFDDIFSATRYTKALEVIKKLHKDQAQEIKAFKLKLETLKTLRDNACELRQRIGQDQGETESLKTQMQDFEKGIQTVDGKIYHTELTLKELRNIVQQKAVKNAERSTLLNEKKRQYEDLDEENEDTDEELIEWKTKFDEMILRLEGTIERLKREIEELDHTSYTAEEKIKNYISDISSLKRDDQINNALKIERDSTVRTLFAKLNLGPLPNGPFPDEVASDLTSRIRSKVKDLNYQLQEKKRSDDSKMKMAWDSYLDANNCWKNSDAQKQAKLEVKNTILRRIEEKEREKHSLQLQISDVDISRIDEGEKNMQIELERWKNQLDQRNFEFNKEQKDREIIGIEQKIKEFTLEKEIMKADAEVRMTLSLKKKDLENHKKICKQIVDEHRDMIRGALKGRIPADKDLKKEITQTLRGLQKEFDDMSIKSQEADNVVKMTQLKIEDTKKILSNYHKDVDSKKRFIESRLNALDLHSFSIESYPKALEKAKEKRDIQKSKFNIADGMRQMFDPFERVARAHHICPCCERPFSSEEEDQFVSKQRVKASSSAEHMKSLAGESSNAESQFQQLDKLRMVYEEYVKTGKEVIPQAEDTLHQLEEELDQQSQALDDVVGVLAHVKADKDSVEALVQPVEMAERHLQDIDNLQAEVQNLEITLRYRGQGFGTVEDIELELVRLHRSKDDLHNELGRLKDEQRHMEKELANIQLRWHSMREKKVEIANSLRDLKKVEEELESLAVEKTQVELEEEHLDETLGPLSRKNEKMLADYSSLKEKLDLEYEEQAKHKHDREADLSKLDEKNSKINEYYNSNKDKKLIELTEQKARVETQLESCKSRRHEILDEISKSNSLMANQDKLRRNIVDNLNYRKTKAEVDAITHEIELLEDRMMKIGGISKFEDELKKLLQQKEKLQSEFNRCKGTMSVYEGNISINKTSLKDARFKDIDKRYFDQLILLKTSEMANKDLDRYYNALDKALMRFHTMKMEEINKIIRELWQQTYRGQDIDYIRIHSDSEGAGTRSYSYKVLMQTGDTELEMRGRCSAGQKVLASLIIRLALAETFCLNCGILALDEPTTNLDAPNSESLAAAILRIMEDRKGQENFQLIVITHDERFAQLIGQRQHAERYYRVAKDDHQHSIIEAQEIFD